MKKVLHIGCGSKKLKGAVGLDIDPQSQADVIHDLEKTPYPFRKNEFDEVYAEHVMEHLENIPKVLEELHRVLKAGGKLIIHSPHFSSLDMFTDPTHKHFMTTRTFDYFIKGSPFFDWHYAKTEFKKQKIWLGPPDPQGFWMKLLLKVVNKHQLLYERRFAFIFPIGVIHYELEVVK